MSMQYRIPLHWSFDYNQGAQKPDFANELITLLQGYQTRSQDVEAGQIKHTYRILPNFWRGYSGRNRPGDSLSIGSAVIQRHKKNDKLWSYNVQYKNSTSGENLLLQFRCNDEDYRTLTGNWKANVTNSGQDIYANIELKGEIKNDKQIKLCFNRTAINIRMENHSLPLTCNWGLYDVIPAIADSLRTKGSAVEISLIDDLEQLRPKCQIGYLDSIQDPIPLAGYYLYGTGLLPSYWWVDESKNVVIVSTVFETLVLHEYSGSST